MILYNTSNKSRTKDVKKREENYDQDIATVPTYYSLLSAKKQTVKCKYKKLTWTLPRLSRHFCPELRWCKHCTSKHIQGSIATYLQTMNNILKLVPQNLIEFVKYLRHS